MPWYMARAVDSTLPHIESAYSTKCKTAMSWLFSQIPEGSFSGSRSKAAQQSFVGDIQMLSSCSYIASKKFRLASVYCVAFFASVAALLTFFAAARLE